MRGCILLLIILTLLPGTLQPAMAMDVLLGRIVSIDRQEGTMVLRPSGKEEPVTVNFIPDNLPGFVREGILVRVWGDFDPQKTEIFQATTIRNSGTGHDPTGVRERIGRGWRRHGGGFGGRGGRR